MKKFTYSVAFVATLLATSNTFAQQGFGTNQPDKSAAVEIKSNNKGLLIPRVKLDNNTQQLGLVANANSLLVFNETGTLPKGYYYWDNTVGQWIPFATGTSVANLTGENGVKRVGDVFKLGDTPINEETTLTVGTGSLKIAANNKFYVNGVPQSTGANIGFLVRNTDTGLVENMNPSQLFETYLLGKNGITTAFNSETLKTEVKLGGSLTENTTIHTQGFDVKIQGLGHYTSTSGSNVVPNTVDQTSVTALGGNVVAVGNVVDGKLAVATAKDIVDAGVVSVTTTLGTEGTQNVLTTKVNDQADQTATVDLSNLVLTGDVTGTLNNNVVTKIQGIQVSETDPTNGQLLGFDGNNWTPVAPSSIVDAGVLADNGLTKTGSLIQLGGNLVKDTTIGANDNKLVIKNGTIDDTTKTGIRFEENGLYVDNIQGWHEIETASTPDAQEMVVAVGKMDTKQMAAATPNQLVRAGFEPDSGIEWDTTNSTERKVVLGGTLDKATTLTTSTSNTLAIAGLEDNTNNGAWDFVVLDKDNKMRTLVKHQTLEQTITASTALTGYNPLAQNVSVLLTLNGSQVSGDYASTDDMTLTLPAVTESNIGQTLTVRISDSNENRYLVISGANESIYGSMTNQEWVFQAEGTTWKVVSRK